MGSIPLPALDVKTPQQTDLVSQYGQLLQLKNAQAQTQLQQQEAPLRLQQLQQGVQTGQVQLQQAQQAQKDQQATTAAMQAWDGKDINALYPLVLKNGGSATAVVGLKSKVLEQQQAISTAFKNNGEGAKALADSVKEKGDQISGALTPLTDPNQIPDAQLPQALQTTVQGLVQNGTLDQQHAQAAQQLLQQSGGDPNKIRQGLSLFIKTGMAQSQIVDQAAKQAQADKEKADAAKTNAEMEYYKQNGGTPGVPPSTQATNIYAIPEDQRTPAQKLFIKGYEKNNDVTKVAPAAVRANVFMQMPQAIADPNNPGQTIFVARKDAIGQEAPNSGDVKSVQATQKFFSPAGKGGQNLAAFNTAQNHLQLLGQSAEALQNGNITMLNDIGQKYAKATGSDAPTNFDAVKNAVKGEVAKALTGNVTVSEQAELDKDFNNASSPKQISGVIQKYTQLMQGKKDVLHQQYTDGMKGKVSFDDSSSGGADPFAQFGGKAH